MRLLVAVKRVIDYNARVRVKPDKVRREHMRVYWLYCSSKAVSFIFLSTMDQIKTVRLLFQLLQSGVDLSSVKMSMNPFCEIAVEVSGLINDYLYLEDA
jgi:electron transfer flavoprotein alpha/beta subunit